MEGVVAGASGHPLARIAPGGAKLVHALLMRPIRPLPRVVRDEAATLKPEQMQQRLVRQFYPVASSRNLRSFTTNAVRWSARCPSRGQT